MSHARAVCATDGCKMEPCALFKDVKCDTCGQAGSGLCQHHMRRCCVQDCSRAYCSNCWRTSLFMCQKTYELICDPSWYACEEHNKEEQTASCPECIKSDQDDEQTREMCLDLADRLGREVHSLQAAYTCNDAAEARAALLSSADNLKKSAESAMQFLNDQ